MLNRLYVKNYAIIDETEVYYKAGLNIMTGETGAGKSILIGSVNAALGAKTSKDMIRYGADYAVIELGFSDLPEKTLEALKGLDVYSDDGEILLSRKITQAGKSICKINGETVNLEEMRECSSLLLDIHGQNEHHSLLKASAHMGIVDKFAGNALFSLSEELKEKYNSWTKVNRELKEALNDNSDKNNDVGYLEYAVNEITAANPVVGEDTLLEDEYRALANSRQIMEALAQSMNLVSGERGENAEEMLSEAIHSLNKVVQYDDRLSGLLSILEDASGLLRDFKADADSYVEKTENSAERFEEVSERLDIINTLKKKYGKINSGLEEVLKYLEDASAKLEKLANFDEYIDNLKKQENKLRMACEEVCEKISKLRQEAAKKLSDSITEQLKDLNFVAAVFHCELNRNESFSANGWDSCEFMISLNPGEPLKPLIKVASGGELSRVMLAIKTVLADKDEIPSLIFDEIDTGISGRTAQKVSEKLAVLAATHQIICITHLAQIASMADTHYVIEKTNGEDFVKTEIRELKPEERITELARILGGVEITDTVLKNAEEMIGLAEKIKGKEKKA